MTWSQLIELIKKNVPENQMDREARLFDELMKEFYEITDIDLPRTHYDKYNDVFVCDDGDNVCLIIE